MSFNYIPPRKRFFKATPKKNVSYRFPIQLVKFYKDLAKETGVPVTDLIIDVLDSAAQQLAKDKK